MTSFFILSTHSLAATHFRPPSVGAVPVAAPCLLSSVRKNMLSFAVINKYAVFIFETRKVGLCRTSAPACVGKPADHLTRKRNTCFLLSGMKNMLIFVKYEKFGQCTLVSENMPSSRQSVDKKSHAVETVKCAALSQNRLMCPTL